MKKNWKNRLVALALTATTALSCAAIGTASGISSSAATYRYVIRSSTCGDVNLDGKVTTADRTLLQKYVAGTISLSSTQKSRADTNLDGYVDADDVIMLQKYLNGSAPYLPFDDSYEPGDVNGDGKAGYMDDFTTLNTAVRKSYMALSSLSMASKCAADVNWDGYLDADDALILVKYAVGVITDLPYKG